MDAVPGSCCFPLTVSVHVDIYLFIYLKSTTEGMSSRCLSYW